MHMRFLAHLIAGDRLALRKGESARLVFATIGLSAASCAQIVGIDSWGSSPGSGGSSASISQAATGMSTPAATTSDSTANGVTTSSNGTTASTGTGSGCPGGNVPLNSAGRTGGTPSPAHTYDMIRPPQPINPGDMLMALVWVSIDVGIAPPSGWTEVASVANTGGGKSHWLWHRLASTDGGTFTFTSTGSDVVWRSALSAYTGVGTLTFAGTAATPNEPENAIGPAGQYALPQVTTQCPNSTLVHIASLSPDPGPISVTCAPGFFLGYGNGILGIEQPTPTPGTVPAVSVNTPAGVGDLGVGTFILQP